MRVSKTLALAAGALAVVGATSVTAGAQGVGGKGTSLCRPVPGSAVTFPAGGPGYNFFQPPPAAPQAFANLGCPIGPP